MLSGLPPFYCRDRTKMWNDIQHSPVNSVLPSFLSPEVPSCKVIHAQRIGDTLL